MIIVAKNDNANCVSHALDLPQRVHNTEGTLAKIAHRPACFGVGLDAPDTDG
jgi:hypothetical protein